jgi:MFS family permease
MAKSLNGITTAVFSLGTSFLLASVVFQPIYASLSYIFGRKLVLLVALAIFLIGAITTGVAENIGTSLAGRTIQGVGAAGIAALTLIIVTDIVPLRQRALWMGFLNAMWTLGSVTGPIIGGAFAHASWVGYRMMCD